MGASAQTDVARACVIGAGPSGLAAAKKLVGAGLDLVVYERSQVDYHQYRGRLLKELAAA